MNLLNTDASNLLSCAHYESGEDLVGVSISDEDKKNGSPKLGDKIARNPKNHQDQWLVAAQYFADNFEPVSGNSMRLPWTSLN